MPKVSVVIPSSNHEKFISEAIQSILDQTYQDFEIVITDDGSRDRSVAIIQEFSDPRIQLFCFEKCKGTIFAVNHSIQSSNGDYTTILSPNDIFLPDKLRKQVDFLETRDNIAAVFSNAQTIDENGHIFLDQNHPRRKVFVQDNRDRFGWLRYFFFKGNGLCYPSILIRSQCYQELGLYDERLAQLPDLDFLIRLSGKHEIHILPEPLVQLRISQNELNTNSLAPNVNTQTELEFPLVLNHYLSSSIQKQFANIFPCRFKIEEELIPFHLAMLALWHTKAQWDHSTYKTFAIRTLYEFLNANSDIIESLEKKYSFSYASFHKLTALDSRDTFSDELKTWYQNTPIALDQIFQYPEKSISSFNSTIKSLAIAKEAQPFWSIMLPVYNPRPDYLKEVVESVLVQFSPTDKVQIEIVDDCSTRIDVQQLIAEMGWDQVTYSRQPHNLGLIDNWNDCIARSRGKWVHLLHQDDKVLPGFYQSLYSALSQDAYRSVGAAFCQHYFIDQNSQPFSASGLEQSVPGILENWIEKIAVYQRIQFAAIAVKREVYETLGGFNHAAESAADWEMWKRIAAYYPVWYEPQVLACFRLHNFSESSRLISSGKNIDDTFKSILISHEYLPGEWADYLSEMAKEHYALYAFNAASQMLESRSFDAALAQIKAGLRCSRSPIVMNDLMALLLQSGGDGGQMDWATAVSRSLTQYTQHSDNPVAKSNLERVRKQLGDFLLHSNTTDLADLLKGSPGKAYKMLLDVGINNL